MICRIYPRIKLDFLADYGLALRSLEVLTLKVSINKANIMFYSFQVYYVKLKNNSRVDIRSCTSD